MHGGRWLFRLHTSGEIFNYHLYGYAIKTEELNYPPCSKDRLLMRTLGVHGAARGGCTNRCGTQGTEPEESSNTVIKPKMIGA